MKTAVTVRLSTLERFSQQLAGINVQNNTRLELTIEGNLTAEILGGSSGDFRPIKQSK
jgi:hypothetical protein